MTYPLAIAEINAELEYFEEVSEVYTGAARYLLEHSWCKRIKNAWLYTNIGQPLCIFLFEIENLQSPEDDKLWVMEGDFPSIYLDTYNVKSTREVVQVYIRLAEQWLKTVETGGALEGCYPFDVPDEEGVIELFKQKVGALKTVMVDQIEDVPLGGFDRRG